MRTMASPYVALGATVLGVAGLALSLLTLLRAAPADSREPPNPPATVHLSLIITGLRPAGGPMAHPYYHPQTIVARAGDRVRLRVMNMSAARHAIEIAGHNARTGVLPVGPSGQEILEFVADRAGVFPVRCYAPFDPETATCSLNHAMMVGYLLVLEAPRAP